MEKYKGKITLGNKEYECEVIDGVRYIDGKTVDEFYNELPIEEVIKLVRVGFEALKVAFALILMALFNKRTTITK